MSGKTQNSKFRQQQWLWLWKLHLKKKNTWANVTVLQQLLFLLAQLNYILLKYIAEKARFRMTNRIAIKVN